MNVKHTFFRVIATLSLGFLIQTAVQAGTNDLFQVNVAISYSGPGSAGHLSNGRLINLALGLPPNGKTPANYKLGWQCDCTTLQSSLVVYDKTTAATVATLANFFTAGFQSNGKVATVDASENASGYDLGAGGAANGDRTRLIVQLNSNSCAVQTSASITGQFAIATASGVGNLNIRRGKLHTFGPQVRPIAETGTSNGGGSVTIVGSDNTLTITNGGYFFGCSSSNNVVTLSNGNALTFTNGGVVINGNPGDGVINVGSLIITGGVIVVTNIIDNGNSLIVSNGSLNNLGGGSVWTNVGGLVIGSGSGSITLGGSSLNGGAISLGVLNIGSNATLNISTVTNNPECGTSTNGILTIGNNVIVSQALPIALCPSTVIHLGNGAVLNVCTNGMDDSTLAALTAAIQGEGALSLTDCATP